MNKAELEELVRVLREGLELLVRVGHITAGQADERSRNQAQAVVGMLYANGLVEPEDEDEDEDEEFGICGACNGSGEGMYDGSTCYACGGAGEACGTCGRGPNRGRHGCQCGREDYDPGDW